MQVQTWSMARRRVLALLALAVPALGGRAQISRPIDHEKWEPLDEIGGITTWFRKMSLEFDRYVEGEKRAQLWRSVDVLRKALYQLEQDSVALRDTILDEAPGESERALVGRQSATLMRTVKTLSESLRQIGADLRLADPNEMWRVEERIFYGFRSRATALTYVQRELKNSQEGGAWPAQAIRERLDKGIAAIQEAQKAVIAFHGQLKF